MHVCLILRVVFSIVAVHLRHQQIVIIAKAFAIPKRCILQIETLFAELIELDFVCQILAQNLARLVAHDARDIVAIDAGQTLLTHCKSDAKFRIPISAFKI